MTSTPILDTLAKEFSSDAERIRRILDLLAAGLLPHHIARYRREDAGGLSEGHLRRLVRRHQELEELDRRRASIRRQFDTLEEKPAKVIEQLERTVDRFELEDLYLPFRRPEPEVQLALDRGLGDLADRLVVKVPAPKKRAPKSEGTEGEVAGGSAEPTTEPASEGDGGTPAESPATQADSGDGTPAAEAPAAEAPAAEAPAQDAPAEVAKTDTQPADAEVASDGSASDPTAAGEPTADAPVAAAQDSTEVPEAAADAVEPDSTEGAPEQTAAAGTDAATAKPDAAAPTAAEPGTTAPAASAPAASAPAAADSQAHTTAPVDRGHAAETVELTAELARLCAEFTRPDRGVHTEDEALAGAMRVLADRLGRDSHLRGQVRKVLRKHGVLTVKAGSNTQRVGRHKALLKISQPMRQIQGHRLLTIRQAQRERAVTTVVEFDQSRALPKVRAALGRHTDPRFDSVLDTVAKNALDRRLLPMLEADVRLELKERGDEEALRFLSQHLRQVLFTPPLAPRPVAGLHVGAKQEWTITPIDIHGNPVGEPVQLETAGVEDIDLAEQLGAAMREREAHWIAVGSGRESRPAVVRLRKLIAILGADATVAVVNEAGLSGYVNGEACRKELEGLSMQTRWGVAIARRLLDPLTELVKVEARHLGLGFEQGLVSKANLKRVLEETIESCVALVGCDVNRAPKHLLKWVPGLDGPAVDRILAARAEQPFTTREDLRERAAIDEVQWRNAASCLRVLASKDPLDHTSIHPDQYAIANRVIEATGQPADQVFGRPGGLKGLRRADFELDEGTWRDLAREIAHPGRDARHRLFPAKLLAPDTDLASLEKGQVVEGFVTNVANFGAFVDLGIEREGLVHISEITSRYVRDARELLSVGQAVRARVTEVGGPRIALSLKDVPDRQRPPRGDRRGGGPRREGRRGDSRGDSRGGPRRGGGPRESWPEPDRQVRVARVRRDGMPGSGEGGRGGRGGPGGGRGGPGGGRGPGRGRGRGERTDGEGGRKEVAAYLPKKGQADKGHNPFARFFDDGEKPAAESKD